MERARDHLAVRVRDASLQRAKAKSWYFAENVESDLARVVSRRACEPDAIADYSAESGIHLDGYG